MITRASSSESKRQELSSSSRSRPLNDSIQAFCHGERAHAGVLDLCAIAQDALGRPTPRRASDSIRLKLSLADAMVGLASAAQRVMLPASTTLGNS
jgi:hypothetical protein